MTLYDQWRWINQAFFNPDTELSIIKSAGVYTQLFNRSLVAHGFGLKASSVLLREARLDLLEDRYIDRKLWTQCIERFKASPTSNSHTFLFNRKEGPKAGGCLLSIVLLRKGKHQYELMITSRAEEVTMALLADMHFVHRCLKKLEKELGIVLPLSTIPIKWHIGVAYQNRTFVPAFFFDTYGKDDFKVWLRRRRFSNEWEKVCIEHSRRMIDGEGVTGARASWGRRLKEWIDD